MSRIRVLEARRLRLLARCDLERAQLAERIAEFKDSPLSLAAAELLSGSGEGRMLPLARPLLWAAALAGLFLLRRPRQVLTLLAWARTAVTLSARAGLILRLLGQLRSQRGARDPAKP